MLLNMQGFPCEAFKLVSMEWRLDQKACKNAVCIRPHIPQIVLICVECFLQPTRSCIMFLQGGTGRLAVSAMLAIKKENEDPIDQLRAYFATAMPSACKPPQPILFSQCLFIPGD